MESDRLKQFLNGFKARDGQKIEIPVEGALGLLALGDIGLIAWRMKKQEILKRKTNIQPEENEN